MKLEYSVSIKFSVENTDFRPTNEEVEKTIAMILEDELGVSVESVEIRSQGGNDDINNVWEMETQSRRTVRL